VIRTALKPRLLGRLLGGPLVAAQLIAASSLAAQETAVQEATVQEIVAQETRVLVVRGIGGDATYRERFMDWAHAFITAATDRLEIPRDNLIYLAERDGDDAQAQGPSRREDIEKAIAQLASSTATGDRIVILLIGHGSYNQGESKVNLPGPDLTSTEFGLLLDQLDGRSVLFVNATESSGGWVKDVSGAGRTIITATKTGMERNETVFGGIFVAAFSEDGADVDKDGQVSALEAFQYTQREVERTYDTTDRIRTEHALLDDNGDGKGVTELGEDVTDGMLAAQFVLGRIAALIPQTDDPVLKRLYAERARLEERVAELRAIKDTLEPEAYDTQLEDILLELALKNREVRDREGGGL
jgi:hypothetical protein